MITVNKSEDFSMANVELNNAELAVSEAIKRLQSAAALWAKVLAHVSEDPVGELIGYAASNRATWSGGCLAARNLAETAIRTACLEQVRSITR